MTSKRQKVEYQPSKIVKNSVCVVDKIYEHSLSKCIATGNVDDIALKVRDYVIGYGVMNLQDAITGETFFHVMCKYIHYFMAADTCRILYLLGTKIDLDLKDNFGDTVLHKVCRTSGAWRCIVALMRCNASPLIRNSLGLTPEEQILHYKYPGWEENLYWLRKFSPGLWAAVMSENPSTALIERLLKSWCRTIKVVAKHAAVSVKTQLNSDDHQLDLVCIVEKYENTNEFALAMLSGKTFFIDQWDESALIDRVDVNTKDHSYQFYFRDYPTAPRPLLAALWETEQLDQIQRLLRFKVNTAVKYTFEAESTSPPKPLFFQLFNPKSKPQSQQIIRTILEEADLNIRDENGGTVLFEAIDREESECLIATILASGINLAARDKNGRTAMDHCILRKKYNYKELLEGYVLNLVKKCDCLGLESLVLQLYDHLPLETEKFNGHSGNEESNQLLQTMLKNVHKTQALIKTLFSLVKAGNVSKFCDLISSKLVKACDKAGRSFLHCAVQCSKSEKSKLSSSKVFHHDVVQNISTIYISGGNGSICDQKNPCPVGRGRTDCELFRKVHGGMEDKPGVLCIIKFLLKEFPDIVDATNNLGQTALHYAYIYAVNEEIVELLENTGKHCELKDVFGFVPKDYCLPLRGLQTFEVRRKPTSEMDLNIFLTESHFEDHIQTAVQTGEMSLIEDLIDPLVEYGGNYLFNHVLFDCIDSNQINLCIFLIEKGFSPNISKQYETCNPENPMCAMMECTHAVTMLQERAVERGATDLINVINRKLKEETS